MQPPPSPATSNPAARVVARAGNQPESALRDERKNVEINVGKACNNRCVFCIDGLPKAEDRSYMPYPMMQAEISRWADAGYRSLGFLGGEPTTYPWIVESVAHARAVGFTRITIATNATKLRKPDFTRRLIDAGLSRVTVSMHGHTAELEDRLTRVPGNFEKKLAAFQLLRVEKEQGRLPDGLSVNVVLNGWNQPHLLKMMRFFYETAGVDDMRVNFIRPEGYAEGDAELTARYRVVVPQLVKAIVLAETHWRRVFTFGGFPLCVLPPALRRDRGLLSRTMGEYRDLSTACSIRSGGGDRIVPARAAERARPEAGASSTVVQFDEAEGRARFNWQDRKQNDLKAQPKACGACELSGVCEGVWKGYLDIWGEDEFQPVRIGETALAT